MAENKASQITAKKSNANQPDLSPEHTRRSFLKKYGKLAVVTPVALTTLMTPKTSHAINSAAEGKICDKNPDHRHCQTPSGF